MPRSEAPSSTGNMLQRVSKGLGKGFESVKESVVKLTRHDS